MAPNAGEGPSKPNAVLKAAAKKQASKESRRMLGYYVAIAVALGSIVLAVFLAVSSGDSVSPPLSPQAAAAVKAQQKAAEDDKKRDSKPADDIIARRPMNSFDANKDNKISMDEIRSVVVPVVENATKEGGDLAQTVAGWENAFGKADADNDGHLSLRELIDVRQKVKAIAAEPDGASAGKTDDDEKKEALALAFVLWVIDTKPEEADEQEEGPGPERNITEAALRAADSVTALLAEGVDPPTEVLELRQAVEVGEQSAIGSALFLLVAKQALDFDMRNGTMVPTAVDFANKSDDKVREKLMYAYQYGIRMAKEGFFGLDVLKDVIGNKLASRVGMDGPAFEAWLGVNGLAEVVSEAMLADGGAVLANTLTQVLKAA